jgi:hypothetical protein
MAAARRRRMNQPGLRGGPLQPRLGGRSEHGDYGVIDTSAAMAHYRTTIVVDSGLEEGNSRE